MPLQLRIQPKDIFDTDAEIEIVMPSSTDSELASTEGSSCSTSSSRKSTQRQRTGPVTAFMQVNSHNHVSSVHSYSVLLSFVGLAARV